MIIALVPGKLSRDDIVDILHEEGYTGTVPEIHYDLPIAHTGEKRIKFMENMDLKAAGEDIRIENPSVREVRQAAHGQVDEQNLDTWTRVEAEITANDITPWS